MIIAVFLNPGKALDGFCPVLLQLQGTAPVVWITP